MKGIENISNKKIVLTGASSGIGYELLKLLADPALHNTILAVSRTSEQKLAGFAPNVIPFNADISSKDSIDGIFAKAESIFDKIDIFYNNAGFPYVENYNYLNWDRVEYIFKGNTLGPIYMYPKYLKHLNGRPGHLCYTISCIGKMALPGYALYTGAKFGLHGFQQAIRLELPDNLKLTCLYPVGTDTNFFAAGSDNVEIKKPWPIQKPEYIAKLMVKGMAENKKEIYPHAWRMLWPIMNNCGFARKIFWSMEQKKMRYNFEVLAAAKAKQTKKDV
ncbi:MAG: SDR family NAD(P)-dependent oxidoreductase [Oscillospiraceae bacterium]|nr:SDR family NAD(P)-dependent oxidoreductase [Oscillospiraceae bacterium]